MRSSWALTVVLLALATLTQGCTVGTIPPDLIALPDGGFSLGDGGGHLGPPSPGRSHPCDPLNLDNDVFHCGACGVQCTLDTSDRCVDASCLCGESTPCNGDAFCRGGRCVEPDPDGEFCEFANDECASGYSCISAHCTFVECVPEDCDGVDNDCDGVVDEGAGGMPLSSFCFNGSRSVDLAAIRAPCRAGAQICADGEWSECFGERLPVEETGLLSCDEEDNNCDGCIDGELVDGACVPYSYEGFDIVYAIDVSGSMSGEREAVAEATRSFSSRLSSDMRFALIMLPGPRPGNGQPVVVQDFTTFAPFETILGLGLPFGSGNEPNWDAVYEAATGEIARYDCSDPDGDGTLGCTDSGLTGLSWRPRSIRIIVLFTDEHGQSYRNIRVPRPTPPLTNVAQADVCDALTHGEVWVTVAEPINHGDYNMCGTVFELTEDAVEMAMRLSSVLVDPCGASLPPGP